MKCNARRTMTGRVQHPIDVKIGRKIARRRTQLGMSLAALAAKLRVSARRMHSLEAGHLSVSASELVAIGAALDVAVFYFFEDESGASAPRQDNRVFDLGKDAAGRREETEELLRAYKDIHDPESRRMLARVVQKLAAGYGEVEEESRSGTRKRRASSAPTGSDWLN